MRKQSSRHDLDQVLSRIGITFDEPESVGLMAAARDAGILTDSDWARVQEWLIDALCLAETEPAGNGVICVDADPRNADWPKVNRARRMSEHDIPSWAALWFWWLSFHHNEPEYWTRVRAVCRDLHIPELAGHEL